MEVVKLLCFGGVVWCVVFGVEVDYYLVIFVVG